MKKFILNRLLLTLLTTLASTPVIAATQIVPSAASSPFCSAMSTFSSNSINGVVMNLSLPSNQTRIQDALPGVDYDTRVAAKKDWYLMSYRALLWQKLRRTEDLQALSNLLKVWGRDYALRFDPLYESQLEYYIQSYMMTKYELTDEVRTIARNFIQKIGQEYLGRMKKVTRPNTKSDLSWFNRMNSHRVKLVTMAAVALENDTMLSEARTQFIWQLDRNLRADSSTLDFSHHNALEPAVNSLESLTKAALVASLRGSDWMTIRGSKQVALTDALDWLLPYAQGLRTHDNEYLNSKDAVDSSRPAYNRPWNPKQSSNLYAIAAILSSDKYTDISQQLKPLQPTANRLLLESFTSSISLRTMVGRDLKINSQGAVQTRAVPSAPVEGTVRNGNVAVENAYEARKDWRLIRNLAVLWQQQRRSEDLRALSTLLDSWGKIYKSSFNPVDDSDLDSYIMAYSISRDALPSQVRRTAEMFIRNLGNGYLDRMERINILSTTDTRWYNNWNSLRVKLVTLAALALNDMNMLNRARTQFTIQLGRNLNRAYAYTDKNGLNKSTITFNNNTLPVNKNTYPVNPKNKYVISSDGSKVNFFGTQVSFHGSTVDFWQRDSMHYVVFNLEPLTQAALAARLFRGEDWLNINGSTGASLSDALDWLIPYANGTIPRNTEFLYSTVGYDINKKKIIIPGTNQKHAGPWDRMLSSDLYAIATLLDTKYAGISNQLKPSAWTKACWQAY